MPRSNSSSNVAATGRSGVWRPAEARLSGHRRVASATIAAFALALAGGGWPAAAGAQGPALDVAGPSAGTCGGSVAGVQVVSGSEQATRIGEPVLQPLVAAVVDQGGCPVPGVDVTFTLPVTGPTATFPGGFNVATVETGSSGTAQAPALTAGSAVGSYSVTVTTIGAGTSTYSASFQLVNAAIGAASNLSVATGQGQVASVGQAFGLPLAVEVVDPYGTPVPGATVSFTATGTGGASATFAGSGGAAEATTGANGIATAPALTAGSAVGDVNVVATLVTSSSSGGGSGTGSAGTVAVRFSLSVTAGPPSSLAVTSGSGQSSEVGYDYAVPLTVEVTDAEGNAVSGAAVTFTSPASGPGGVFAGHGRTATVTTTAQGMAQAPKFSPIGPPGGYLVKASVPGVSAGSFAFVSTRRTSTSLSAPAGSYLVATAAGAVAGSGGDHSLSRHGRAPGPRAELAALAAAPGAGGYWTATTTGHVSAYGDAPYYGSPGRSAGRVVGIAASPDGHGYWLASAGGGVFAYGDARYYGSPGRSAGRVVGIAASPDGHGYWLVTTSGAVHAYGDATFLGSAVGLAPKPVVGIAATDDGAGYYILSSDGTLTGFGDAGSQGTPTFHAGRRAVAVAVT